MRFFSRIFSQKRRCRDAILTVVIARRDLEAAAHKLDEVVTSRMKSNPAILPPQYIKGHSKFAK